MAHPIAHSGVVHLRVGKQGVTDGLVEEIAQQLGRTDPLVIKFLQNFRETEDRKAAAKDLADRTGARIDSFVGGKLVLTRRGKN